MAIERDDRPPLERWREPFALLTGMLDVQTGHQDRWVSALLERPETLSVALRAIATADGLGSEVMSRAFAAIPRPKLRIRSRESSDLEDLYRGIGSRLAFDRAHVELLADRVQIAERAGDRREVYFAIEALRQIAERARPDLATVAAATEEQALESLGTKDKSRIEEAFRTIGGAWDSIDRLRRTEERREFPSMGESDAPMWVRIDGTQEDAPFAMGADDQDKDQGLNEAPPHYPVHLSAFEISSTVVTCGLYRVFDSRTPIGAKSDEPMIRVSWLEARLFCRWATMWLRRLWVLTLDKSIDLPTEAQWEFVARLRGCSPGGSRFHSGREDTDLSRVGWWVGWPRIEDVRHLAPFPVAYLEPASIVHENGQAQGRIWDLHGNVLEWCRDWYEDRLEGGRDPIGPPHGAFRVMRGGSYFVEARHCRASLRGRGLPAFDGGFGVGQGFRLVLAPAR